MRKPSSLWSHHWNNKHQHQLLEYNREGNPRFAIHTCIHTCMDDHGCMQALCHACTYTQGRIHRHMYIEHACQHGLDGIAGRLNGTDVSPIADSFVSTRRRTIELTCWPQRPFLWFWTWFWSEFVVRRPFLCLCRRSRPQSDVKRLKGVILSCLM